MTTINFTVEKMFILPDCGALKAFADIIINDVVVIRGVRVLEGTKGLFVRMPQEQGKDNRWYDQVVFRTAEAYEAVAKAVLDHYAANKV